ncbi:uncharacterized protein LOC127263464 isoform X3 [Andrographis paniculata]|uniref:uncharacterized protein LOC127263464 isoform X3 n=1 Tax=Andrographis paniculata TaxID=175694 RepID=UPI0021E7F0FD|nr:uncharacterized protein LOC127263464 isoform X3 [Andrographis paniculata]
MERNPVGRRKKYTTAKPDGSGGGGHESSSSSSSSSIGLGLMGLSSDSYIIHQGRRLRGRGIEEDDDDEDRQAEEVKQKWKRSIVGKLMMCFKPGNCLISRSISLWKPPPPPAFGSQRSSKSTVARRMPPPHEIHGDGDGDGHRRTMYIPSGQRFMRAADRHHQDITMHMPLPNPNPNFRVRRRGLCSCSSSSSYKKQLRWKTASKDELLELLRSQLIPPTANDPINPPIAVAAAGIPCSSNGSNTTNPNSQLLLMNMANSARDHEQICTRSTIMPPLLQEYSMSKSAGRDFLMETTNPLFRRLESTTDLSSLSPSHPHPHLQLDRVAVLYNGLVRGSSGEGYPPPHNIKIDDLQAFVENSHWVAYRACPNSVYNVSIKDCAFSSSEHINTYDAELQELRLQLQLLKINSALISGDSRKLLSSLIISDAVGPRGWEASLYVLDVLIHSGLKLSAAFDGFRTSWHSPESPLNSRLFDALEARHDNDDDPSSSSGARRPERMLLFDRVNSALVDLFRRHVEAAYPRVMGLHSIWDVGRVMEALSRLADHEIEEARQLVLERAVDKETQWRDCNGEVGGACKEIEELVVDELMKELLHDLMSSS